MAGRASFAPSPELQSLGPLPAPDVLKQYEDVQPGLVERVVSNMDAESAHRRDVEKRVLEAQIDDAKAARTEARLGQVFALAIGIAAIVAGAYVAAAQSEWVGQLAGGFIGGGGVIGLVSVFILGQRMAATNEKRPGRGHSTDGSTQRHHDPKHEPPTDRP